MRRPVERPLPREALADEPQDRHLALGPLDAADAFVREAQVGDVVRWEGAVWPERRHRRWAASDRSGARGQRVRSCKSSVRSGR